MPILNFINYFVIFWFIDSWEEEEEDIIDVIERIFGEENFTLFDYLTLFIDISKLDLLESLAFTSLSFITIILLLVNIAFYTLAERKIMAAIQRRKGPNIVGFLGILQPVSDGLKLLNKEIIFPTKANKVLFMLAPFLALTLSFVNWMLIAFSWSDVIISLNLSLLVLFTISSFNIYSIILSGWASNSRYPFLGAIRAASQMISYEVSITLVFLCIVLCSGSFNLLKIIFIQETYGHYWLPLFPVFIIFLISILAETNRAPFDLPEAEAEIVAGYNLEYSSITFALFFLGEYGNMLLMSALTTILFFGGWHTCCLGDTIDNISILLPFEIFIGEVGFVLKTLGISFFFIIVRATFPRLRYDQLMLLGWTVFLPLSTSFFIFLLGLKISFSSFASLTFNTIFQYSQFYN